MLHARALAELSLDDVAPSLASDARPLYVDERA